jgi:hypothetical protein
MISLRNAVLSGESIAACGVSTQHRDQVGVIDGLHRGNEGSCCNSAGAHQGYTQGHCIGLLIILMRKRVIPMGRVANGRAV